MSEHPVTEFSYEVLSTDGITFGSDLIPQPIDGVASLRRASDFTWNGYYRRHNIKSDTKVRKGKPYPEITILAKEVSLPPRT